MSVVWPKSKYQMDKEADELEARRFAVIERLAAVASQLPDVTITLGDINGPTAHVRTVNTPFGRRVVFGLGGKMRDGTLIRVSVWVQEAADVWVGWKHCAVTVVDTDIAESVILQAIMLGSLES